MKERWVDIPGYEDLYQVSDRGKVRSLTRLGKKGAVPRRTTGGYLLVSLRNMDRVETCRVHRLVLEAFVGPSPEGKNYACHRNDIPDDNRLENLYWGSPKDNANDRKINRGAGVKHSKTHPIGRGCRKHRGQLNIRCRECRIQREMNKRGYKWDSITF